jgi:IS1 family transposase
MPDRSRILQNMNKLSMSKRTQIVAALVEGNSINAITRMFGASKHTVLKLLEDLGFACAAYHHEHVRNLKVKRVEADEIWQFCYAKNKNVPDKLKGVEGIGDVWTWVAIDGDSKLAVSYLAGKRDAAWAHEFMNDLASRINGRFQLTTDGHRVYLDAVEDVFGSGIDYAMLQKVYGAMSDNETRYSPAQCIGCERRVVTGNPDRKYISTSYVERSNLTMRMSMRRFTRLTNAHSKKIANHRHAIALHFMFYNYCRIHQSLRVTPAMEAGLTNRVWSLEDLVGLMEGTSDAKLAA